MALRAGRGDDHTADLVVVGCGQEGVVETTPS